MIDSDISETTGHDEKFSARYLGVSVKWLQAQRQAGTGPSYYKAGKLVRYTIASLRAFQQQSTVGKELVAADRRERNSAQVA